VLVLVPTESKWRKGLVCLGTPTAVPDLVAAYMGIYVSDAVFLVYLHWESHAKERHERHDDEHFVGCPRRLHVLE
jgi:hypothetical protein